MKKRRETSSFFAEITGKISNGELLKSASFDIDNTSIFILCYSRILQTDDFA